MYHVEKRKIISVLWTKRAKLIDETYSRMKSTGNQCVKEPNYPWNYYY